MADFKLGDYVDVATRIREFMAKYPQGSLQTAGDPRIFEAGNKTFIAYHAAAYRTPDDPRPGHGWAWEPIPGPTPYTRDSELMNAETAAWGRAIVALGFATKHVASQEEVRNRQDWRTPPATEKADGNSGPAAPAEPGEARDDASPAGAPEEDPSIENYRLALELLRELGWKWSDAWVASVIGRKPDTAQEAREALWAWLQAVKGRNLDIFIKQCQQAHRKQGAPA